MLITFKDKTTLEMDMYAVSVGEIRAILEVKKSKDDQYGKEDEVVGKTVGMTAVEIQALPYPKYRKIVNAFWAAMRDPLQDDGEEKNSVSGSISA